MGEDDMIFLRMKEGDQESRLSIPPGPKWPASLPPFKTQDIAPGSSRQKPFIGQTLLLTQTQCTVHRSVSKFGFIHQPAAKCTFFFLLGKDEGEYPILRVNPSTAISVKSESDAKV